MSNLDLETVFEFFPEQFLNPKTIHEQILQSILLGKVYWQALDSLRLREEYKGVSFYKVP